MVAVTNGLNMLVCTTQQQMKMQSRTLFLSLLAVSLILLYQASSIGLVQVYSKEKESKDEEGNHGHGGNTKAGSSSTTASTTGNSGKHIGSHSQVEIEASGKVVGGRLQGAKVKVEVNAKFAPDGTFQEGRIEVKIQQEDTKVELKLPASSDSHIHPPASGGHTSLSDCPIPNPSAHIVSTVTGLNIQIIGGTGTSNVALQGLSPILGTYGDVLCLSGTTQIAGK